MEYRHLGRTGPAGQPPLPRHDELRPADRREADSPRDHGSALELRHQLLRHRERLRLEDAARARPSRSSAAGSRRAAAGARRSCSRRRSTATMGDWPNESRLSALHIRRACEDSLRRLQTDHIDLYQMHHVDRHAPWDEIWQAMETLVAQGKVLYVGSSNFAGWHIAQANETARGAALPRPRLRAEPLQPDDRTDRARGDPRLRGVRPRRHPVEPAARAACSAACSRRPRCVAASSELAQQVPREAPRPARGVRGAVRRARGAAGRRRARVAPRATRS